MSEIVELKVSVIICTHNRSNLLAYCLQSLVEAHSRTAFHEIIVVNNACTDHTDEIVRSFASRIPIILYHESKIGLSYARNSGAKQSSGDWLLYIDDDGKVRNDVLIQLCKAIALDDFKIVTGIFKAWDLEGIPKWFPYEWANYLVKDSVEIRHIGSDHITGGILAIEKKSLENLGFFPTSLGMHGNIIAYGEETYIELLAKDMNIKIGINPFMILDHVVNKHKQNVTWLLQAYAAKGRDGSYLHKISWFQLPIYLLRSVFLTGKYSLRSMYMFCTKTSYYWQNVVIDIFGRFCYYFNFIIHTVIRLLRS